MVDSSNMDFILVFSLILAVLSTGHSNTQVISDSCYKLCPPGYHKVGDCNGQEHRCEKCDNSSYTEKENSLTKCNRCDACGHYEKEIKPCSFDGDVVCDCKDEYYNANPDSSFRNCQECRCTNCEWSDKSDYFKKCKPCKRCPECQHKCATTTSTNTSTSTLATPSTTSTTSTTSTFMTKTTTRTTLNNMDPETTQAPTLPSVHRLFYVGAVVAFLVLFWFLLMFTRNPIRYPESFPCWNVKKDLELASEDLKLNEQPSHHGSCPTSLTINISEESPMMALSQSPAILEHPQHIGPVLPDAEHKATREAEQSEHWPAIVLYAIIKEVPLRRWKEFLRLLSVADQQLERVELEAGLGSIERQYQMLRLWSQRSSANLNDIFSALHYMDLSGCAQLLQESLDKLQWRPDLKQCFTDHGLNGATQDT